jgi:serine kinase of HPr protein (carbohydrate metabolism regulator)
MMRVHASSVAIGDRAVLLFGPSGAGKSDLALRLIDEGATLVSDDYTELSVERGSLRARSPVTIRGRIEVRGLGILPLPCTDDVAVALAVDLGAPAERLPEPTARSLLDVSIPCVAIDPRAASAAAKVRLALNALGLPR